MAKEIILYNLRDDVSEEDYSLVEGIHNKLVALGIQKAGYPPEYGGGGQHSHVSGAIPCEELAKEVDAPIYKVVREVERVEQRDTVQARTNEIQECLSMAPLIFEEIVNI